VPNKISRSHLPSIRRQQKDTIKMNWDYLQVLRAPTIYEAPPSCNFRSWVGMGVPGITRTGALADLRGHLLLDFGCRALPIFEIWGPLNTHFLIFGPEEISLVRLEGSYYS